MKKIFATTALALTLPFAASAYAVSDAGCGLGSVLLEGKEGMPFNILAATLNATSGNQTFAMSTGTLNCAPESSLFAINSFVSENMDALALDAARGEGEALDTLASLWGMDDAAKAAFGETAQARFQDIFSSEQVTSDEVVNNFNQVVSEDARLAAYTLS